ncbi:hypothetical protein Ahy_B02g058940 [Arachis hypogaea]|uniref:Transposase MuDR plant domain-containing protein n=1 Tax=Arachis hypogaea TaxID=3818 RepID=A0A445AFT6_ARAHY|nr:hypothetical protein Ahy_B02g058940 [Arachis hypogaea]
MPGPDTQTEQPKVGSDEPNLPTHSPKITFEEPPRIIQTPDAPTEPNLPPHEPLDKTPPEPQQPRVPVGSQETRHRNPVSAESVAPTIDKGPAESNEVFTQYIPQSCNEPESQEQTIQNENETPCEESQPSSSQPEPSTNPDVGGGSPKKRKRRSTVRPPPSGQTFIPNQDPNKHPSIFIPVEGEDMFGPSAGMHCYESEELDSIASDDEDSQQAAFPQANPDAPVREVRLEVGMEFENLEHFKKAVRKFNINLGRSIFFPRIDSTRCKAICYDEDCPWQIYCAKRSFPLSFQVKTFVNEHTCSRVNKNKSADGKWVVEELEDKIRDHPDMTQRQAHDFFKKEFDVIVNERKIYRAMVKAKELIEGSEIAQYALLRDYANEIIRTNPGSTVRISTDYVEGTGYKFKRIYICLEGCKKGFSVGCRPFIGLDGTFLKGYYPGQLLTAIGHDANNHIYPIAYAMVECECKDSWKWFLELLQQDLGDAAINGINFMSDMQKVMVSILIVHVCLYN